MYYYCFGRIKCTHIIDDLEKKLIIGRARDTYRNRKIELDFDIAVLLSLYRYGQEIHTSVTPRSYIMCNDLIAYYNNDDDNETVYFEIPVINV